MHSNNDNNSSLCKPYLYYTYPTITTTTTKMYLRT